MATTSMTSLDFVRNLIEQGQPDVLRSVLERVVDELMEAEVDVLCGAARGERSEERVNWRNGHRERDWDTRAGTISLQIPKLRQGSYFPDWLLERRRRAEAALVTVVATSYLLGVSTRRMEKLVETLGITRLSKPAGPASTSFERQANTSKPTRPSMASSWSISSAPSAGAASPAASPSSVAAASMPLRACSSRMRSSTVPAAISL